MPAPETISVPPSAPARLVVLASGTGSLLQALLQAAVGDYPARVVAVGLDRECRAATIAADAGIPSYLVRLGDHSDRPTWDAAITEATAEHTPDLIVSAGFMKILGPEFLSRFPGRVINTHPALLPSFPGAHAVPDALDYGVKVTGCTVHLVSEEVDAGRILAQAAVPVLADDNHGSLVCRIQAQEHQILPLGVALAAERLGWLYRQP